MKRVSFWQKYLLIILIASLAIIAGGFYIFLNADKGNYAKYRNDAMVFAARIIETDQNSANRFKTFSGFADGLDVYMFDFWIVDSDGLVIDQFGKADFELNWAQLPKPVEPFILAEAQGPGPLFGRGLVGVIRLSKTTEYLVFSEKQNIYSPIRKFRRSGILSTFLIVFISILVVAAAGILYMKSKATAAIKVLNRLQEGHLHERLSGFRFEKESSLVVSFNSMADEIERLIKHIRRVEDSRRKLLEELTHDLFTPLSSVLNIYETLLHKTQSQPVSEEVAGYLNVGYQETRYIQYLIDGIVLLAQQTEPKYDLYVQKLNLAELINGELAALTFMEQNRQSAVEFIFPSSSSQVWIMGNGAMLTRMIRNALENAIRYAKQKVFIEIRTGDIYLEFQIRDDGPGFSSEALRSFGVRSHEKRDLVSFKSGLAAGLGSAIMKSICQAHGGSFSFGNCILPNGETSGAQVTFKFEIFRALTEKTDAAWDSHIFGDG